MLKKNLSTLIIFILIPIAVGMVSSVLAGNIAGTYGQLTQPELSPPAAVFPIIWTLLYTLMGISSFLIFVSESPEKEKALWIYFLQLFINFLWSPIFFGLQLYLLGFLWLLLLIVLIVIMIRRFYSIDPIAAYLQIPYLLWCVFAAYLSYGIYTMNT
jgi:tryptophan-rich sensory protein